MNSSVSISIPTERFLQLVDFLRTNSDPRDPASMVMTAIDYWIDNASWKPELLKKSQLHGFQWKSLFLPDGTQIRMQYKGAYFYAAVQDDKIVYDGRFITPSQLANTITASSRNAWRDLWIKRPVDAEWVLADECRRESEGLQV